MRFFSVDGEETSRVNTYDSCVSVYRGRPLK